MRGWVRSYYFEFFPPTRAVGFDVSNHRPEVRWSMKSSALVFESQKLSPPVITGVRYNMLVN